MAASQKPTRNVARNTTGKGAKAPKAEHQPAVAKTDAKSALVVGSAMLDVIALIAPDNIERMAMRNERVSYLLLEEGRKVPAQTIESHIGGGGCNASVSLSRQGWKPTLLAKLGDDVNARAVRDHLEKNAVDPRALLTSGNHATGVSIMIASHDRNAGIFVHRGANEHLAQSDVPSASAEGVALLYIGPLSSGSADCFPFLAEAGRFSGAIVAANPGVRQLTSRAEAFFSTLGNLDLLSVNADEAASLIPGLIARGAKAGRGALLDDAPELYRRGLHFGGHDLGLRDVMEALHAKGPRWVAVTDGAQGAYLSTRREDGRAELAWCPPAPATVAGTAGAGDAWCSTLAASLADGRDSLDAMRRAAANSASVVEQVNTSDGLLDHAALDARVESNRLSPRVL